MTTMTAMPLDLITRTLLQPSSTAKLSMKDWDLLIRQGRRSHLLGRLAQRLKDDGLLDVVPLAPRLHLLSTFRMVERQDIAVRWEVRCLGQELSEAKTPLILLKGAAYVLAGVPTAAGRLFSDVDILVRKQAIGDVESWLMIKGWQSGHIEPYDQRYYRRWMHEIPPMRHVTRGTTLDVHHAILPESARIKVNTAALFDAVIPLENAPGFYVLAPVDMLLHSATHLFHEGELEKGLRDLFDLDGLIRHFDANAGFWPRLVPRAVTLGLTRPLFYAVRYLTLILETPIPQEVRSAAEVGRPSRVALRLMDWCYLRALRPAHSSAHTAASAWARFVLYVRSHWIRMPPLLLAYHLGRKAVLRLKPDKPEDETLADAAAKRQ